MEVVTTAQHRILAFVHACNRSGYRPAVEEVKLWFDEPVTNVKVKVTKPGALTGFEAIQKAIHQQLYGIREVTQDSAAMGTRGQVRRPGRMVSG